ncbi:MAG: alpha/beta fold hydrolase [Burkholderiales bacterium]|nr:MAG: alpha/beta fold hydrolase [Burkholderiales bacterium]
MILYLHGFRSSPLSFKAVMLSERMAALGLASRFACPQLPASPREAMRQVCAAFSLGPRDTVIGSSLGGYYATWLAGHWDCRVVLLNPAVRPYEDLAAYLGPLRTFHTDEPFEFRPEYLAELRALESGPMSRPERCLLVAATGDELLDWRDMVARHPDARRMVIDGSDHGLSDFDRYLDRVLAFAGMPP